MYDEKIFDLLKGSTILDPEIFKKKKDFFYNTSYDILIKGDLGNSSKYLEIFKECGKKATITPIKRFMPSRIHKLHKNERNNRNHLYYNKSLKENLSSVKESKMLKGNKSQTFFSKAKDETYLNNNNIQSLERSLRNTRPSSFIGQSFDNNKIGNKTNSELSYKTKGTSKIEQVSRMHNNNSNSKSKSKIKQSHPFGYNLLEKNSKIIKLLYNTKTKNEKENEFKKQTLDNDRSRTLVILRDYFQTKQYNQIKSRYIQLFGNETFSQRLKKTNNRLMNSSHSFHNTKDKNEYINVLNNIPHSDNQKTTRKKYNTRGLVKILNVPVDFYNSSDLYYSEDKAFFAQNAKQLYSIDTKLEKRMKKYFANLSKSKNTKEKKDNPFTKILKKFEEFETKGMMIKNKILDLKQFLNKKSPIIDKKIFAYIDDDLKEKTNKIKQEHKGIKSAIMNKSHSFTHLIRNKKQ